MREHDFLAIVSHREHADVPRLLRALDSDLADNLAFLRTLRNGADYDLELSMQTVELQAEQARRRAESVIARLDALAVKRTDS